MASEKGRYPEVTQEQKSDIQQCFLNPQPPCKTLPSDDRDISISNKQTDFTNGAPRQQCGSCAHHELWVHY